MLEWKDTTSYSRGDKERIPRILEIKVEGLRIVVHRIIHYPEWYVSCYDLNIEDRCLYVDDLYEAKIKAIDIILEKLEGLMRVKEVLENEKI